MKKRNLNVRKFNIGGDMDLYDYDRSYFETDPTIEPKKGENSNTLGYISAGIQGVTAGINNYNAIDSTALDNQIKQAENTQFTAQDNANLISQWNSYNPLDEDYNIKDVGFDWGEQIGNTLSATASGGWIGFLEGVAGNVAARIKANNKVKEAEDEAKRINLANQNKFLNQVKHVEYTNDMLAKRNSLAKGGSLNSPAGFININEGGKHSQNPFGGVQMGVDNQGIPNLVEEGEVIYNDYVYSNTLKIPKSYREKYKLGKTLVTFADVARDIQKGIDETPNDPITKRGVESRMEELRQIHEEERMKKDIKKSNKFTPGGQLDTSMDWMKYGPLVTTATGLVTNLLTPHNYEYANRIAESVKPVTPIKYTPMTARMTPSPMDVDYTANKIKAESAANRNAILNTANNAGAARAGIIALDRNAQDAIGDAYRQAYLTNREDLYKALDFNRAVEQFNIQQAMATEAQNRQYEADYIKNKMAATQAEYAIKDAEDSARAAAISAGLEGLGSHFYNIYKDRYSDAQLEWMIEKGILPAGYTKI